jgi:gluconate 5-dehydrogenase
MQRRGAAGELRSTAWHELMRTNVDSVFHVGQAVART